MSNQIGSGTAAGLIEFLDQLIEKGRGTTGSITPLKITVKKILAAVDGEDKWAQVKIGDIDIEDYLTRFKNKTIGIYSEGSYITYKSRLNKAKEWYTNFLLNPGWAPTKKNESPVKKKNIDVPSKVIESSTTNTLNSINNDNVPQIKSTSSDLITYPFPLRAGKIVHLYLPIDLTLAEAKRLGRYLETLSIDSIEDTKVVNSPLL